MYYLCHPNNGQSFQKPSTSTLRSQMAFHFLMFKYEQTSFEEILNIDKDQGKQEKKVPENNDELGWWREL